MEFTQSKTVSGIENGTDHDEKYLLRRALNYSYWAFENYTNVRPSFVEKASKTVFEILKNVRNTKIEINCIFIYWVLHEMLFIETSVDSLRIEAGIANVKKIATYFDIVLPEAGQDKSHCYDQKILSEV